MRFFESVEWGAADHLRSLVALLCRDDINGLSWLFLSPHRCHLEPHHVISNHTTVISNPTAVISNSTAVISNPTTVISNPNAVISNPNALISNSTAVISNKCERSQNPALKVPNSPWPYLCDQSGPVYGCDHFQKERARV
jgi:hypothetical protein